MNGRIFNAETFLIAIHWETNSMLETYNLYQFSGDIFKLT